VYNLYNYFLMICSFNKWKSKSN